MIHARDSRLEDDTSEHLLDYECTDDNWVSRVMSRRFTMVRSEDPLHPRDIYTYPLKGGTYRAAPSNRQTTARSVITTL